MQQSLPFLCPLDHVFPDPSYFDDSAADLALPFRESSFLTNPRAQLPGGRPRSVLSISARNVTLLREEWRSDMGGIALVLPQVCCVDRWVVVWGGEGGSGAQTWRALCWCCRRCVV